MYNMFSRHLGCRPMGISMVTETTLRHGKRWRTENFQAVILPVCGVIILMSHGGGWLRTWHLLWYQCVDILIKLSRLSGKITSPPPERMSGVWRIYDESILTGPFKNKKLVLSSKNTNDSARKIHYDIFMQICL